MTVKECYELMEGDYFDVINRLSKDERVEKYLKKFAVAEDFSLLKNAVDNQNIEEIFRYSHNLKGMSANLSFTKLALSSSNLCENVRPGVPKEDCGPLMDKVIADYNQVINAINQL